MFLKRTLIILAGCTFFSNLIFALPFISVTNPLPLTIQSCVAGSEPRPISSVGASYTYASHNKKICKISAFLNSPPPPNTSLAVQLSAPTGAQSSGFVTLTTTPQNLVIHIPPNTSANLPITYLFTSQCKAGVIALTSRTVTFTIDTE